LPSPCLSPAAGPGRGPSRPRPSPDRPPPLGGGPRPRCDAPAKRISLRCSSLPASRKPPRSPPAAPPNRPRPGPAPKTAACARPKEDSDKREGGPRDDVISRGRRTLAAYAASVAQTVVFPESCDLRSASARRSRGKGGPTGRSEGEAYPTTMTLGPAPASFCARAQNGSRRRVASAGAFSSAQGSPKRSAGAAPA
jgi:hypothetical protein